VGGEAQASRDTFAFAESGKFPRLRSAPHTGKKTPGEPGHTRDTRVHTGTCAVSSFMNIGCDFQVTDSQVKSSQVKQASKQVKLLAAGAHSIDLTLARSDTTRRQVEPSRLVVSG
jgi:hypothetical protein